MITTSEFRVGVAIVVDGEACLIVERQHVKRGRGGAFVRCKLKNLRTGSQVERTFDAGEKVETARVETRKMQFLYVDGSLYHFMDNENYEQVQLSKEELGETFFYLKEGQNLEASLYNGKVIGISPPLFVELQVVNTEPGLRGDTVSGGSKPATLETGLAVLVPLFIDTGDVLKIDTRSGEYVERV